LRGRHSPFEILYGFHYLEIHECITVRNTMNRLIIWCLCGLRGIAFGLMGIVFIVGLHCCGKSEAVATISIEQRLLEAADGWMGTPYLYGGTTKEGVDCSALTKIVYKQAFDVDLPRRVRDQKKEGVEVTREELKPGDLVVFKTGSFISNKQHIGIYLSESKFLHASTSEGVTISSLEDYFWKKKYRSSRRLFDDDGALISEQQIAEQ